MKHLLPYVLAGGAALTPLAASAQDTTITYVTHPALFAATGEGAVFEEFTRETGIKVEVQTYPGASLQQRIMTELASGSGAFDVVALNDQTWTTDVIRFMTPLDELMAANELPNGGIADFSPGFVSQYRVPQTADGDLYGVPIRMSVDILYYRKDILDEHGIAVPTTYDEYLQAARTLREKFDEAGQSDMYPVVMQGNVEFGVPDWYDWVSGLGGNILTPPDWDATELTGDAAVAATALRRQFIEERLANPAVVNYGFDDAINAMAQGNAAMTVMYSAYWNRLEDPERSSVAGKIGYAHAPREPELDQAHFSRGWALFVPAASENQEAAWAFIRYLSDVEPQLFMALNHGNAATRLSVIQSEEHRAQVPISGALADSLPKAKIMPNIPGTRRIYDEIGDLLTQSLAGKVTAEEAMQEAEARITPLLPEN